jgi:integrase
VAREGGDPRAVRDKDKRAAPTFEEAARHVYQTRILPATSKPESMVQWLGRLERHAFPVIGKRPIHTLGQADLLRVLEPIWLTKAETARRVRQRMAVIFDWARTAGHIVGINPVEGIEAGLPRQRDRVEHRAALPWRDLPALWPRLEAVDGMGSLALRFAILTAARSGEVRGATWVEVDLDVATWTIPAARAKMERAHRVPLSPAAVAILEAARGMHPALTAEALVFPAPRGGALSEMTLSAVLRRLGVAATVHGFRSTFRDWAEEAVSFPHEVKELALGHAVKSKVEAAYRRGDLLDQRRPLMDAWARFVPSGGAEVIRLAAGA